MQNENEIILLGDFNLPKAYTEKNQKCNDKQYQHFSNFLNKIQPIFQCVNFPTREENILDLIFVRDQTFISQIDTLPPIAKSDHCTIFVKYCSPNKYNKTLTKVYFKNFQKTNYAELKHFLRNFLIHNNFQTLNAHDSWQWFNSLINIAIDLFVPTHYFVNFKNRSFSQAQSQLFSKMKRFYSKYKKTGFLKFKTKYKYYKLKYRNLIKITKFKIEHKVLQKNNSKNLFTYIKSYKKHEFCLNKIIDSNGHEFTDPLIISNAFNKYFISVFENPPTNACTIHDAVPSHLKFFDKDFVRFCFSNLKNKSYKDPAGVPSLFYIKLLNELDEVYTHLFNVFYAESYIPNDWKISCVIPLYKGKGSRFKCENYRPISKNCAFARIFETAIKNKLEPALFSKLSNCQHGFVPKRSTISNLLTTYFYVYSELDAGRPCDVISVDFSKAFDKIPMVLLIEKLKSHAVDTGLVNIVAALLANREQIVQLNGSKSSPLPVASGVPQGSPLSPLLFNLFINDLLSINFTNRIIAFADDIKLIGYPGRDMQNDLNLLWGWAKINKLKINLEKCTVISFGNKNLGFEYYYDSCLLTHSEVVRDLGVLVDNKLKFFAN